jgi:DNA-binding response OmpR family regulator
LPIIALTADAQSETRQKAKDCGIDDLLLKPFDHKVLTERIYMLLKAE